MRRVDQRDPAAVGRARHVDEPWRARRGRGRRRPRAPAARRRPPRPTAPRRPATRRRRVAAGSPTWSAHTTSAPRPAAAASSPSSAARAPSSSPPVGSSRTTTSGSPASAAARATRWRWPCDSAASGRCSGASRAAATSSPASASPRTHASWRSQPRPVSPATAAKPSGAYPVRSPGARATRPRDGAETPATSRSSVDLPDAVGALHGDDRARPQLEVDVAQDRRAQAVALGDLCERDQNAPRRDSTAGTVLTRIERSRKTDQRSR